MSYIVLAAGGVCVLVGFYLAFKKLQKTKFLQPSKKLKVKLIEKEHLTHDVRRLRFELPDNHVLGLPVGQYIFVSAMIDGKLVSRPYTPVTSDDDVGYFDCVVKVYFAPRPGVMTLHLDSLNIGDTVDIRGPIGRINYQSAGTFTVSSTTGSDTKKTNHIGMICGGSGITPMLQIIRDVLKNPSDGTKLSIIFANQTEEDILLRKELDHYAAANPDRLHVWYTVDKPPASGWKYSTGFIDEQMIRDNLPVDKKDPLILLCGPPPMIKFACLPNLEKCGVPAKRIITY